jgi:hypothetical protein
MADGGETGEMAKLKDREALDKLRLSLQTGRKEDDRRVVSLCAGSGCGAQGAEG